MASHEPFLNNYEISEMNIEHNCFISMNCTVSNKIWAESGARTQYRMQGKRRKM